jgi:hypothetical protein
MDGLKFQRIPMFGTLKRISFGLMVLSAIASVFTTLGTLNGRLSGGFTTHNTAWAIAVGIFAGSVLVSFVLKVLGPLVDETRPLH